MFLEFVDNYPQTKSKCNEIVKGFIEVEEKRNKDAVPNLGEFLAIVSASDYTWDQVRDAYLDESFVRNVFWLLSKYPELEDFETKEFNDQDRLKVSFDTTRTSQKLLLFHQFFLDHVARRQGVTNRQVMEQYDHNMGRPSQQVEELFLNTCETINNISSYQQFFTLINKPDIKEEKILDTLKSSIIRSKQKGYHGSTLSVLSPEEFAKGNRALNLDKMILQDGSLEPNDDLWKQMCEKRWGLNTIPDYLSASVNPWRKLYLQNNLQDLLSGLNDAPDFTNLHKVLDLSKEIPRVEIYMFDPTNIKSKYHFITLVVKKITDLECLIIRKGESKLNVRGFKALTKGLASKDADTNKLTSLILDYCGMNEECIKELTTREKLVSANLERLVLTGNPLNDQGAIYLSDFLRQHSNLPQLTHLDLSDCNIQEKGAKAIAEMLLVKRKLKTLVIHGNQLSREWAIL